MAAIKKQEAGFAVKVIFREPGLGEATLYDEKWKYGGMQASNTSKLRGERTVEEDCG